jgi:predicted DCC family thiol-disulfide oxidoreductase YuxK
MEEDHAVILFDGVCNLCNTSVDFIIRKDKKEYFKFGALQQSADLLEQFNISPEYLNSLVLIEDGQVYYKSTAALKIARRLDGPLPILYPFILLPTLLRDPIYNWIANNRYQWFGKGNSCRLPTPEEARRFI